uniref:SHC-transforming protein n=1 Tax=Daphnia magna TaxID=35525 RepID=A0A0P4YXC6_9CRUS
MTTQDWTRMLKSFRTKTYRNLPTVEDRKAGSALNDTRSSSVGLCDDVGEIEDDVDDGICRLGPSDIKSTASDVEAIIKKGTLLPTDWTLSQRVTYRGGGRNDPTTTAGKSNNHQSIGCQEKKSGGGGGGGGGGGEGEGAEDKLLAVRGRSASEPSFLSASRAVKVRVSSPANNPSSYTPPTVKEISSITGLQQQIKAAFGRWRKRGTPSSPSSSALEEEVGGPIREDCFDHPLNVRLSAQSQTFSHPHRLTVFPPFPSGGASPSSSANVSPARSKKSSVFNTSTTPSSAAGGGGNSKSGGSHPFSFVRGLRKRRATRAGEASEAQSNQQHRNLTDLCSDRLRSRTAAESGWPNCTTRLAGQDHFAPFGPLTAKSRSDHSLHRILKEDNTWTVFATLRPPSDKGGSLSKGTTAWTFGLFSDPASQSSHQRRQTSTPSVGKSTKSKAASVAPSPELVHRAFTPCFSTGTPSGLVLPSGGGLFGRNERRTRSLERCSQQRVRGSGAAAAAASSAAGASWGYGSATAQTKAPPPIPSRVRSRSLEKNYTISTTTPHCNRLSAAAVVNNATAAHSTSGSSPAANSGGVGCIGTPLLPVRRNNVPPEVLATWCTFNEAFGGGRPKHQHRLPSEPLTVNDERDSPGSPVFEELFLPPPQKFAALPPPIVTAANPTVAELVNNNNNNKRNSVSAASCCCCSSCSGGHSQSSAGVSCSSKSTPRSSPVPPTHLPETVLYGTREAPVLERHCVEGGEFIIAWLSHSNGSSQQQQQANPSSGGNRVGAAALVSPPSVPLTSAEMQSSTSSSHSATAATGGNQGLGAASSNGSNRSFINKPARGWLHSDAVIVREGITYFVRYIGCLEVNTSMKSLDFDTRSQIAKECINIVCETAGLKTVDKKRKVDRRIQRILGDAPHMEHAGSDVALTISSGCLRISTLEGSAVVACHDMPNISFASGGDPDTLDFVAYVAKDNIYGRACYVLECGGGLAQDVITTIGQAFELRFKEYLKRTPRPAGTESVLDGRDGVGTASGHNSAGAAPPPWSPDDPEYYNDLPGKVPPDVGPPPVPPLPNYQAPLGGGPVATGTAGTLKKSSAGHQASDRSRHTVDLSDNLIDLNADVSSMGRTESGLAVSTFAGLSGGGNVSSAVVGGNVAGLSPFPDHEYVNGIMGSSSDFKNPPVNKDPFDMHPFSATLPSPLPSALLAPNTGTLGAGSGRPVVTLQRVATKAGKVRVSPFEAQLLQEIWFHGPISRKEAEDLLKQDGDFLVRESQGSQGQYVLTGMQSGHHKHLLLVDPEGVVRTKDRTFESVSHLINFHRNNVLPIISAESVLLLKRPVPRAHHS